MSGLAVVITMAGFGKRFSRAGYKEPKWAVEAKGRSLFDWSMDSLADFWPHADSCTFVCRRGSGGASFALSSAARLGIPGPSAVELGEPTDGQATTCLLGIAGLPSGAPLLVYNIDTYVEPGGMRYSKLAGDGHIPCFHARGDHWSFVKLGKDGRVSEVREKVRISNNCSLGAYWFSSVGLFKEVYAKRYGEGDGEEAGERYIAPMYSTMLDMGLEVTMSLVDARYVHPLGTPDEVRLFESDCCPDSSC